jgi:hypothetical protein
MEAIQNLSFTFGHRSEVLGPTDDPNPAKTTQRHTITTATKWQHHLIHRVHQRRAFYNFGHSARGLTANGDDTLTQSVKGRHIKFRAFAARSRSSRKFGWAMLISWRALSRRLRPHRLATPNSVTT